MAVNGRNNYKLPHMHKSKNIADFSSFNYSCSPVSCEGALAALAARIANEQQLEALLETNSLE